MLLYAAASEILIRLCNTKYALIVMYSYTEQLAREYYSHMTALVAVHYNMETTN